jgi:hypothetical protein
MEEKKIHKVQHTFDSGTIELFEIARRAAKRMSPDDTNPGKKSADDALIAIIFSAISVEAFLNDLATLDWQIIDGPPSLIALDGQLQAMRRFLKIAEESNMQPTSKLLLLHDILGKQLDQGRLPLQDYILLKQLRDAIVHAKPSTVTTTLGPLVEFDSSRKKILRALESRGLLPCDPSSSARHFLAWLANASLANWAVKSASTIVLSTIEALPVSEFKDTFQVMYRDFKLNEAG